MHDDKPADPRRAAGQDWEDDEPTRTLTQEEFLQAKARAMKNLGSFLARLRVQEKAR